MNIFVVDVDPSVAARQLCDKHIVKMPLETAQMLCTVSWCFGIPAPYKATHAKHPCTLWASETWANWDWLVRHGVALCDEYTRRFGRRHGCLTQIFWCSDHGARPKLTSPSLLTPFAQAMPEQYRGSDAVAAYRAYYIDQKARFARWRAPSSPPYWWPFQNDTHGHASTKSTSARDLSVDTGVRPM